MSLQAEGSVEPGQLPPGPPNGTETQENGVGPAGPRAGGDQRDVQSFETQIQETSKCPVSLRAGLGTAGQSSRRGHSRACRVPVRRGVWLFACFNSENCLLFSRHLMMTLWYRLPSPPPLSVCPPLPALVSLQIDPTG